jgi:hypothetical protein
VSPVDPKFQSEEEHWDAWLDGKVRCPICTGLPMDDFEAVCDCSRHSLETTGKPLVIQVIDQPETATIVVPTRIIE